MVRMVSAVPAQSRKMRRPSHTFRLRHRPFALTPFLIAPVLPGETMKNLLLQSRVVTQPIVDPLAGWHLEYYLFYVKLRDLPDRDTFSALMLDPSTDISAASITAAARSYTEFTAVGQVRWVRQCLQKVTEEYFRDEGEAWDIVTIDGYPVAKINSNGWWDSLILKSAIDALDPNLPDDTDNATMGDLDVLQQQYEFLKANLLVKMSFEDYLKSYGVRGKLAEEPHRPELIRYIREWSYPTNTIDPADGSPTSAVSWAIAERADKDRFFGEPGFIFGVTVARPKVYFSSARQAGCAAGSLKTPYAWLPAIMSDHPWVSLINETASAGLAPGITADYVWDARDLFMYGDQFLNFDTATAGVAVNNLGMPEADGDSKYPTSSMARALFIDTTDAATGANFVRQDGVVSLQILGTQQDMT